MCVQNEVFRSHSESPVTKCTSKSASKSRTRNHVLFIIFTNVTKQTMTTFSPKPPRGAELIHAESKMCSYYTGFHLFVSLKIGIPYVRNRKLISVFNEKSIQSTDPDLVTFTLRHDGFIQKVGNFFLVPSCAIDRRRVDVDWDLH